MKNPIRNETSLVLVVAVIFSAVAIPVLSGFLEPSRPPAVGAVQIGDPRDGAGEAPRDDGDAAGPGADGTEPGPTDDDQAKRRRSASRPADSARPGKSAPSAAAGEAAEDDGSESD